VKAQERTNKQLKGNGGNRIMLRLSRYLAMLVILVGIVSVVVGAVFVTLAVQKDMWIVNTMRQEKVTLGLTQEQIASGEVVDNAKTAQAAADKVRADRHAIAPTYNDLIAPSGGRYDPTNPKDLSYTQALNLENYLYMAVLSFGVLQEIIGTGVALILIGIALVAAGLVIFVLVRRILAANPA
jgi:hypothetical protein